jgi:hypothetical protein
MCCFNEPTLEMRQEVLTVIADARAELGGA